MKLKDIIKFLDERIPPSLALDFDKVGFKKEYDLNHEINSIKILMDLLPQDDNFGEDVLIVTHHPPLFIPKTPTYTIHSNWDIIKGGANEALAYTLNLNVEDYFDNETNIGRVCSSDYTFDELKKVLLENFENIQIVNPPDEENEIENIAIISGFGLKNPEYIKLAHEKKLNVIISGDLTQETAILAKNLGITLINLGHHESEIPGLYALKKIIDELGIDTELIDRKPIQQLR